MKQKKQTINKEPEFKPTDVRYCVEVDYERTIPESDDDYGRRTTIYDEHVTDIDVNAVIDKIAKRYASITYSKLNRYIFDRLCILNEVYNPANYTVETVNGYYGEEVAGVTFNNEENAIKQFTDINNDITDIAKIKTLLKLEYGFLPEYLNEYKGVLILPTDPNNISIPQERYWQKIKFEDNQYLQNYALPRAVCTTDNGEHFTLVDGYHRIANALINDLSRVEVVALLLH